MWRRVLVVGIFVVFIFAIALMAHNDRKNSPIRKVQEEIERLKREGEPTSWQEIAPPVPKHLDGTPLYRKAFAQLEGMLKESLPGKFGKLTTPKSFKRRNLLCKL